MIGADRRAPLGGALACAVVAAAVMGGSAAFAGEDQGDASGPSFWSRVTLVVPVYTRHFPHSGQFDERNWGLLADVALSKRWSIVGGDYINSFHRHTAFAGISFRPVSLDVGKVRVTSGVMVGADLNGGYRTHDPAEPLLGALELEVSSRLFERTKYEALDRVGVGLTLMPGGFNRRGAVPVNLALTYRFGS